MQGKVAWSKNAGLTTRNYIDWQKHNRHEPSLKPIQGFGTWLEMLREAGVSTLEAGFHGGQGRPWRPAECQQVVSDFYDYCKQTGSKPTVINYDKWHHSQPDTPSRDTLSSKVGNWRQLKKTHSPAP